MAVLKNLSLAFWRSSIPIKKKYVKANDGTFMTKELCKAMMDRSMFRNRYNKYKTVDNNKWRNRSAKILREIKHNFYNNLDLFTDTVKVCQSVILKEKGEYVNEGYVND